MADTPNDAAPGVRVSASMQGVLGSFNLAELQSALAAFTQNYGPVDDSQYVDINLLGPINCRTAVLSPIEIVPALDSTDPTSFLLSDFTNAVNDFVQNLDPTAKVSIVSLVFKLYVDGWEDPKLPQPPPPGP